MEKQLTILWNGQLLNDMKLAVTTVHNRWAACASGKEERSAVKLKLDVYRVVVDVSYNVLSRLDVVVATEYEVQNQKKCGLSNSVAATRTTENNIKPRVKFTRLRFKFITRYPF